MHLTSSKFVSYRLASLLGTEVVVPVNDKDGKPELNEDGTTKTQVGFRPFINYQINLRAPLPTVEAEIEALTAELGQKVAQQKLAEAKGEPLPAPTAVALDDEKVTKSNGVAKKPVKAAAKRKGNL